MPDSRIVLPLTDVTVACSLSADEVPDRLAAWQRVVGLARRNEPTETGVRLVLPASPELAAEVAALVVSEKACCPFFGFALDFATTDEFSLEVAAPEGAAGLVADLLAPRS